jgi:predicted dehydrogenase
LSADRPDVVIAIIGAGFISEYHINGLVAAGGARISALVGRRLAPTEERARLFGIPRAETDYRAVLDDASIDAVVVSTPDDTHEKIAIEALAAGKAVLLQKPMALTSTQCRAILAAEADSGSRLTVSFMHRYFPEVLWLRRLLAEGGLGRVHSIRMRNATPGADWNDWVYSPGKVSGGVVMQLGVHGIDLCQLLFGPIRELSARVFTTKPERVLKDGRTVRNELEDNAFGTYRFAGGVMGSHEMSYTELAGCDRFRLEIYGEKGTVWLRSERGAAAIFAPELTGTKEWILPSLDTEPFGAVQHRDWLAIVRGDKPRDDTPEAGLSSIVVAEHIYRASHWRRAVAVE